MTRVVYCQGEGDEFAATEFYVTDGVQVHRDKGHTSDGLDWPPPTPEPHGLPTAAEEEADAGRA